ncbi:MAG: 16S rRNA (cytidine(1402)-2'-O)-methyltransferase [Verrucomicrobia bacterium]|nr:16S rRNA (cytidine(1402)-2'-O)-methyltransferase [Verrucomicrobiota bacterium]
MLTLIPTPIGNLGDITLRAIESLQNADLIACEDTRHSGNLLRHLKISKPLVSYHEHNEARRTAELLEDLANGKKIALISDAGMPGISDPGHRLLRACIERGLPYTILPGPSAVLTALIGSGFPAEQFFYGGFLPVKSGGRERDLRAAAAREVTSVFFESPHRLLKSLAVCAQFFPQQKICVARELSKQFEEYRIGFPPDLLAHYSAKSVKGEIVLLITPNPQ